MVRLKWSMVIPSGLSKSVRAVGGRTHFMGLVIENGGSHRAELTSMWEGRRVKVKLPVLMTGVGSPLSALALLIEGDVISVQ